MQRKSWMSLGLIAILLIVSFLVLNSSAPAKEKKKPTCCKASMGECPVKNKTNSSGEMIMESLSRQFIAVAAFSY